MRLSSIVSASSSHFSIIAIVEAQVYRDKIHAMARSYHLNGTEN